MGAIPDSNFPGNETGERNEPASRGTPCVGGIHNGFPNVPDTEEGWNVARDTRLRGSQQIPPGGEFSLRGIRDSVRLVRECSWRATLDLEKGCYQVLMHPHARQYPEVEFGGRAVVANILPSGLPIVPMYSRPSLHLWGGP